MKHALQSLVVFAFVGFFAGCHTEQPKNAHPNPPVPAALTGLQPTPFGSGYNLPESLISLNKMFLDAYKERQGIVKSNTSPLIVASFSSLVLYWRGVAQTNSSIPDIYHALKAIAHVPFGIFLRVDAYATYSEPTLPDSLLQELNAYTRGIDAAEVSLPEAGFSQGQLKRQKEILKASKVYVTKVISTMKAPRKDLISFTQAVGPLMLENAADAAAAELELTHAAVMQWKKQIPPDEWKRLVVVVCGLQMPRRMNILTQYFAKVLGEPSHNLGYPLES